MCHRNVTFCKSIFIPKLILKDQNTAVINTSGQQEVISAFQNVIKTNFSCFSFTAKSPLSASGLPTLQINYTMLKNKTNATFFFSLHL